MTESLNCGELNIKFTNPQLDANIKMGRLVYLKFRQCKKDMKVLRKNNTKTVITIILTRLVSPQMERTSCQLTI